MAAPLPNIDETRDNATFEALMWALSRPGVERRLPEPGLAPVAQALVDLEVTAFTDDEGLQRLIDRTGARPARLNTADYLFLASGAEAAFRQARTGSAIHPEAGATLVVAAPLEGGPRLRLAGPGIDGSVTIAPALPPELWDIRAERVAYPLGFDLFLVDGDRITGLPRSTRIEVL
ncbi:MULTISPECIES: phosphonate C-P lyase system protein PhnH [unclassified Haematobacter]|uniref:phosphonate C-P lyase system protein PhnH n=1 Tax=unclassified Haematobacter TaxID=2640585 RepID=UPI0025C0BCA4|nr:MULTISPECIES: phosphonate C-P lyase system protein PhnH [unclassified Haematobacter]